MSLQTLLLYIAATLFAWTIAVPGSTDTASHREHEVNPGLTRLIEAYPEHLCNRGPNHVEWRDGTRMPYDDGRAKSFSQKLADPDLQDQMSMNYPATLPPTPTVNHDPGRVRFEPFFKKIYGSTPAEVESKLQTIIWLPGLADKKIRITTVNNVHKKLESISDELLTLPKEILDVVKNTSGAFRWRNIKDTNRLSAHSFGIALDVGVKNASYWLWARPNKQGILSYRNKIPMEVVTVFEKHGFIWGGKWYHFDSMHFEYRPELIDH